jgi:thiosulfate/3-mercaptopyruvate sulfurtransferase
MFDRATCDGADLMRHRLWATAICVAFMVFGLRVANAEAPSPVLVSPAWLAAHLRDPSTIVVDIGGSDRDFRIAGHVPGARLWNTEALGSDIDLAGGRVPWPSAEGITAVVDRLGLAPQNHVVLVTAGGSVGDVGLAARAFLMFRAAGFRRVSILNGGIGNWMAQHNTLSHTPPPVVAATDWVDRRPVPHWILPVGAAHRVWQAHQAVFVDARIAAGYRSGHIPGAVNVPSDLLLAGDSTFSQAFPVFYAFKSDPALEAVYRSGRIPANRPVVFYCGSGLLSAEQVFVGRYLLGRHDVNYFPGSIQAWDAANLPVAVGAKP